MQPLHGIFSLAAGVFLETFKSLSHVELGVLYPIPDFTAFDKTTEPPTADLLPTDVDTIFLSINRYERKKNLGLAIRALGLFAVQYLQELKTLEKVHSYWVSCPC